MVIVDRLKKAWQVAKPIIFYAEDHAEKFTCKTCGRTYISRGKYDPGNLCRDCEVERNAILIGGPFNGEKAK